jgi:hypothetical protein
MPKHPRLRIIDIDNNLIIAKENFSNSHIFDDAYFRPQQNEIIMTNDNKQYLIKQTRWLNRDPDTNKELDTTFFEVSVSFIGQENNINSNNKKKTKTI